jgi:hypothetical protein
MADVISTVVVQRASDDSKPDVVIRFLSPLRVVAVRGLRTYLQVLVGLVIAGATGAASGVMPPAAFGQLLWSCAGLAIAPAVICVLQNSVELLARLDESAPQSRA